MDGHACDTVSGLVGYCNDKPTFEGCLVENAEIGGIVANAAGILGSCSNYTNTIFKDINVKNTRISNTMTYDRGHSNSTAAGILGYIGGQNIYTNCKVENCQITGSGACTSGMMAVCNGGTFTNCVVKDTTIKKNNGGVSGSFVYQSVGGIITSSYNNDLYMCGCSIENVNISGDTYSIGGMIGCASGIKQFDGNKVKDLTITGTSERNTSSNGSIGAMIADFCGGSISSINDCDITNFTTESGSNHSGGIIGTLYNSSIKFVDCDLDNLDLKYTSTIPASSYNQRCLGGLVAVSGEKISVENCTSKNSKYTALNGQDNNNNSSIGSFIGWVKEADIKNSTITNNILNNETQIGMAGGAIGANLCSATYDESTGKWTENHGIVKTDNLTVKDCTITANGATGGIMGYGVEQITNSTVNNCTIKDNADNGNGAGGLVGFSLSIEDNSITNSSVINSNITSKDYAGGIIGFTSGTIDNCQVTNTTITSDSTNGSIGGIVGMIYDPSSKILNSTVSNSEIEGTYYTGGIVGFGEGDLTNNKVIENSTVTAKGDWAVGGIIGMTKNTSSEITNCDVDNIGITGITNYTGGIAGYANNTISGCDVNEAQIIATGETVKALGGILGHASNTIALSNCSIANAVIQGNGNDVNSVVGNVLGNIDCISGCTVDEDTVIVNNSLARTMELDDEKVEEQVETKEQIELDSSIDKEIIEDSDSIVDSNQDEISVDNTQLDVEQEENKDAEIVEDLQEAIINQEDTAKEEALNQKQEELKLEDEKTTASDDNNKKEEMTTQESEQAIITEEEKIKDDSSHIDSSSI